MANYGLLGGLGQYSDPYNEARHRMEQQYRMMMGQQAISAPMPQQAIAPEGTTNNTILLLEEI